MELTAPILRIEKVSLQDGPGLRTVIFFKGCPLRCAWCSTPESQSAYQERYYQRDKCTLCTQCVTACPQRALALSSSGEIVCDNTVCTNCLQCAGICPTQATKIYGTFMTVKQVMRFIHRDELFYFHSGGGVTLSGGDVLCYPDFARELLSACKQSAINTTAELDMYGEYNRVSTIFPYLDSAFVDIKLMDSNLHKRWTNQGNETILNNTQKAAHEFPHIPIHIRVPLIQGVNDSQENLLKTSNFCAELPSCKSLEFLPYHRLGLHTYDYLGRDYPLRALPPMEYEQAMQKVDFLTKSKWPFRLKISGYEVDSNIKQTHESLLIIANGQ